MKTTMKLVIGSAFALTMALSGAARADIVNSAHDLSGGTEELCAYCHIPHNGDTASAAPLWNRVATTTTFTMYSSPTIDMTIGATPGDISLACLSCHDGSLGYNSLLVTPSSGASDGTLMSGSRAVGFGGDLSNDHPIAVTWDTSTVTGDPNFNTAASVIAAGVKLYGAGADQVECASCHDPHDPTDGTIPSFLRVSNAQSGLCTTCHTK